MNEQRKWFTKKRYLIPAGLVGAVIAIAAASPSTPQQATQNTYQPQVQGESIVVPDPTPVITPTPEPAPQTVDPVPPQVVTPPPVVKVTPPPAPKPTPPPVVISKPTPPPAPKPTPPPVAAPYTGDKDCKDFANHAQAQAYFDAHGGSPSNNFDDLDRDHDGIACE